MRFSKIHLAKFGMFTDTVLEVSSVGVNVIVGKNEAGKSTAMAAITQLLYGIPQQSTHDYVHKYSDFRIGGVLVGESGIPLEVYRIKKNGPSLRSASDDTIGDDVLRDLLSGVSEDVFTQVFSISHDEIAEGGAALLSSDGELGAALFSAGSGLTTLNAVLAKLDSRAGELFKSAGSKPLVNASIARFKELTAQIKETSQSSIEVERLNKARSAAELQQVAKDAELKQVLSALNKANRVRRSKVLVLKRQEALRELGELEQQGPRVDSQIPGLLTVAAGSRFTSTTAIAVLKADLAVLDGKLDDLAVDELLVAQSGMITSLTQEIGTLRVNYKDLPGLNKQVGDLERSLAGLVRRLPDGCRRDASGTPQLTDVEIGSVQRLVAARGRLEPALESARQTLVENELRLASETSNLLSLRQPADVANLAAAVARNRQDGQLEVGIAELCAEADGLVAAISAALNSVGLRSAPRQADAIPLPDGGSVHDADGAINVGRNHLVAAETDLDRLRGELAKAEHDLQSLIRETDPPSTSELATERDRRNDGWQLVRAAWLGPEVSEDRIQAWTLGEPLDRAFEVSLAGADAIADRMLNDAQSVERREQLERQITSCEASIGTLLENVEQRRNDLNSALSRWNGLWEPLGIGVGDRKAMDNVLGKAKAAAADAVQLRKVDARLAVQQAIVAAAKADLRLLLAELSDAPDEQLTLAALVDRADARCVQAASDREARALAERAVDVTTQTVENGARSLGIVEHQLTAWRAEWSAALVPLGLPAETQASDVLGMLKTIADIDSTSVDLDDKRRRVAGIERRNAEIKNELRAVLQHMGRPELGDRDAAVAIVDVKEELDAAVSDSTRRATLAIERAERAAGVDVANSTLVRAETDIRQLVEQSNMRDEDELRLAVARTEQAAELESSVAQWESELLEAAGVTLSQVESEVNEFVDADVDSIIEELSGHRDDLDEQRTEIAMSLGGLRTELGKIDESYEAALAAEKAQATLAELSDHADEYVRVVMAKQLLEREIEDYRERNQGPILRRAAELFTQLTLQRYRGIETDTDKKGKVVLQAETTGGSLIEVARLSTGTRDQLYLALRLAALEHFAEAGKKMPLLLDDLFVHFDDERTQAGLRVLAQLSSTVQVLLFTHHEQVAEQAKKAIDTQVLTVLHLGTSV